MPTSLRLNGDRDRASMYWGEAKRILFQLKNDLELQGIEHGWRNRRYTDGTTIRVGMIYGADIIEINSPFLPIPVEKVIEILYYLRFAYLISVEMPANHYRFHRLRGKGLPSADALTEISFTDTGQYYQVPYFLVNNRAHKRDDGGNILLMPSLPNESFGAGTVANPNTWPNQPSCWGAYENDDYFDKWGEYIIFGEVVLVEDADSFTRTRTHGLYYKDVDGPHTISPFITDGDEGTVEYSISTPWPGAWSASIVADYSYGVLLGNQSDFDGDVSGSFQTIGNNLIEKIDWDMEANCNGSITGTCTFVVDHYEISLTIDQTITKTGTFKLYFGSILVDSGSISFTHTDAGLETYKQGGEGTPKYDKTGGCTSTGLGQRTYFAIHSCTNIEDSILAVFYKKTTDESDYEIENWFDIEWGGGLLAGGFGNYLEDRISTIGLDGPWGTGFVNTRTRNYYLFLKTKVGTEKILLATNESIYDPILPEVITGYRIKETYCNITEKFILYAYKKHIYSGGSWVLDSIKYGQVSIATGERKEFSYTPAEYYGTWPPTIFMYIPREREKQP